MTVIIQAKIIVSWTGLMCDKQSDSGYVLKIEQIEFTDKFCVEFKRRKDIKEDAWSVWLITKRMVLPLYMMEKTGEGQVWSLGERG